MHRRTGNQQPHGENPTSPPGALFRTLPFHMLSEASLRRRAVYHTPPGATGFSGWRVLWFSSLLVSRSSSGLFKTMTGAFSWARFVLSKVKVTRRAFDHESLSF